MVKRKSGDKLVWIDLEMTGLDYERDRILEIACIVTDFELQVVAEAPVLAIHHDDQILDNMNDWCTRQHNATGLVDRCRDSQISEQAAGRVIRDFILETAGRQCVLAGSSVHADRAFLLRRMPEIPEILHYRIVDVTSIKVLAQQWYPDLDPFVTGDAHTALADIRESIAELRFYRQHLFR